ncbi:hypothetical protein SAMN05216582_12833 [Selenomonas ruminantium]|uniref:Uncharacterized protein n=1 Tax=Selenomonas ruminantium TaxID=971 RepID=A0A1M6WUR8_SELRU|nr:hypothetical protein [Selenomonas ruminantium]SHK97473.1 hypothetical protein SAMN05216582_12833 [Selenomonas ruminantium]
MRLREKATVPMGIYSLIALSIVIVLLLVVRLWPEKKPTAETVPEKPVALPSNPIGTASTIGQRQLQQDLTGSALLGLSYGEIASIDETGGLIIDKMGNVYYYAELGGSLGVSTIAQGSAGFGDFYGRDKGDAQKYRNAIERESGGGIWDCNLVYLGGRLLQWQEMLELPVGLVYLSVTGMLYIYLIFLKIKL